MAAEVDEAIDGEMDYLGSESLTTVLEKINELDNRNTNNDSAFFDLTKPWIRKFYKTLSNTDLDGDRMLRRRLDLVRAFIYPDYESRLYSHFAEDLAKAANTDRENVGKRLDGKLLGVIAIPSDLSGNDIIQFVHVKKRLDDLLRDLGTEGDTVPGVRRSGQHAFNLISERIRFMDPMTAANSAFGEKLAEISQAAIEASAARDAAKKAAGQTADATLSAEFAENARRDGKIAGSLSTGSIAGLVTSFGVGFWAIGDLQNIAWTSELGKLALTLPLFGVSAYLGRLSTHYREAARWAKTASVQLKTIDAYTQVIEDSSIRDEIRISLGKRVFGDPGFASNPKNIDVEDVTTIIDSIANALKRQ